MQHEPDTSEMAHAGDNRPVGLFDSGVGGVSVLHAIRQELPNEDVVYVADSGCAPYGDRPAGFIAERAVTLTRFLIDQGAKAVVVACNTATALAVETLRARFTLPIVAIEPAVKPAASRTHSKVVGVLATTGTASSPNMGKLLANYGSDVQFVIQPCPGLADLVERGALDSVETRALVESYVRPVVRKGADILVLGCTHYPFLRPLIQDVAGPGVEVIDPAVPVARELRRRLAGGALLATAPEAGSERFWTTGSAAEVEPVIQKLWNKPVHVQHLPRGGRRE